MAIVNIAVLDVTAHSISYTVGEDGNAVDTVQRDVPGDLVAGPLNDLLSPAAAIASQAAARNLVFQNCDLMCVCQVATVAGATATATLLIDPNIQGAAAGNFRLDFTGLKAANADTATYIVRLSFRHSLIN